MNTTWVVIGGAAALLVIYDIYTGIKNGTDSTISWQIYTAGTKYPILPFAFGVLMGHFFAGMHGVGCNGQ